MPTLPRFPARAPLTAAAYAAFPEDSEVCWELQEGSLVLAARPPLHHQAALGELLRQLRPRVPPHLRAIHRVDVDLQLVAPDQPGTVRVPDVVVVREEALVRVRGDGGPLRAGDVVLAVEVLSPGSRRTDSVVKHAEYADAGIGHYWMIDLLDGPSLVACHHGGALGYVDEPPVRGAFATEHPFPARLDLAQLR